MQDKAIQWLVITDLDGTLLNHHNYDIEAAKSTIIKLQEQKIPIIFNTSKTFKESIELQKILNLSYPFIVENGSCIYYPKSIFPDPVANTIDFGKYWAHIIGTKQESIKNSLNEIDTSPTKYKLLSESTIKETIELTGLTTEQAKQAISREFSEPLVWYGNEIELNTFKQQLKARNLHTLQGGRFLHVIGECNKGIATNAIKEIYGKETKTIILGDSANDADMLSVADISAIVKSPSNHQLQKIITPDIQTINEAPSGWAEAISTALLSINKGRT